MGEIRWILLKQENKKKEQTRSSWKRIGKLLFLAAVFLTAFLALKDSWGSIWNELKTTSFKVVTGVFFLSILYNCCDGCALTKLLRTCDENTPWSVGIGCSFYYSFFRVVTFGSGTAPAGMYYVSRRGIPASRSLGIFTINYTIQRISICLYFLFSFLSNYGAMNQYFGEYKTYMATGVVLAVLAAAALITACVCAPLHRLIFQLAEKVIRKEKQKEDLSKWQKKAIIVRTEARSLLKNKKLLLDLFILNFLKLSAWYLIPVTIFHLLNSSELSLYMATAAMMTALSGVIPAPGGVGAAEFLFVLLFTPLIGKSQSASAMLIYRFATYILPFILGAIVAATTHSKKNPA
ncbi:UPF0104 family protein [Faecalicatena contorta]|uniref:lysylphosphatidylglycerol synthase transmembrane domain-containing protein n=2 Tax=Faecalicatena contorta TaxID=39482 RepID=UPI003010A161|nr:UPF0104 family protein [Faecalicatena contorta]